MSVAKPTKPNIWPTFIVLLLPVLLLSGCDVYENVKRAMGMGEPVFDTQAPQIPTMSAERPRILNFSKTNGFRHDAAIEAANQALNKLAQSEGWQVFHTENGAVFNDRQLAQFDVIFANNCTGDNWNDAQKAAFKRYMENGGGFVGVHGAAGTRFDFWDWYKQDLLRAQFLGHPMFPQFQTASLHFEDRSHPSTRHFPEQWQHEDEWYSFSNNPREDGAHVLATLDESSYEAKAMGSDLSMGDHPIIWSHCMTDGGRVFYSALGHTAETYRRPEHQRMLKGALSWAMGLEGDCP